MAQQHHHERDRGARKNSLERYVPRPKQDQNRDGEDDVADMFDNLSLDRGRGRGNRGRDNRGGRGGGGRVQGGWSDNRRGGGWGRGRGGGNDDRMGGRGRGWQGGGWGNERRDGDGYHREEGINGNSEVNGHRSRNENVNRRNENNGFDEHTSAHREKMMNQYQPKSAANLQRPKKNTENFNPCHDPPEMRIMVALPGKQRYHRDYTNRDVLMVPNLVCEPDDMSVYQNLLKEMEQSGVPPHQLWQLWHGDSHVIADDKRRWKELCPTFNMVLDKIRDYFNMDIKATRLNWYRDQKEWKPFHHDAAAMKADKAKTQNFTVALSFGGERDAAFEHAKTKTVISMPQPNGTAYTFGQDINILWRHGILQVPPEKQSNEGRISIIAWGWIEQVEL